MAQETIHSGHFMTSNPHTEIQPDEEDGELEVDVVEDDDKPDPTVKDLTMCQDDKPVTFYKFGPKKTQSIAIDVSLNKLKKCIQAAYSKMTTPKWKDFKGIKLHWKQRIRLNNIIWRAYYMEFGKMTKFKKAPHCYFSVPEADMTHTKIEGSVLEGMYWKRGMPAVCAQYKRWRNYNRSKKTHDRPIAHAAKRKRNLSGPCQTESAPANKLTRSMTPDNLFGNYEFDDMENIFTDELFETLNQPYMFPDREMMMNGNADFMQPGLLPLQPSLEEIMASLEQVESHVESERCSPIMASQATEHVPGPSSIPTQVPPTVMAPPPMAPTPRMPQMAAVRPAQDYAAASMLVDYSNTPITPMPTRQPSSITSQMLMLSAQGVQPQYSTAVYDTRWKPPLPPQTGNFFENLSASTSSVDLPYIPQFLQQTQTGITGSQHVIQSSITSIRSAWWPESPMTVVQSPQSSMTPIGAQTPLTPNTPLLALGPSTPPSFRSELRSPVVRTTNDPHDMLSKAVDGTVKSTLTHHLEQPSLLAPKIEYKQEYKTDWSRPTSSNTLFPPTPPQNLPHIQRSAPSSAPVMPDSGGTPWKFSNLQPPPEPVYPSFRIATSSSMEGSMPTSSEAETMVMKEEPQLMSAPPSVKPPRSGSRQVQADSTVHPEERKRILHLCAEQNRRTALKDGFDQLMELIPDLYSGGVKPTNAVVLAKSAEHIRRLLNTKEDQQKTKLALQEKIAKLQEKINTVQANLPTTSGLMSNKVEPKLALENFHDGYVKEKSKKDFRFWVMAKLLQPLTIKQNTSFAAAMSGDASKEELGANCADWLNSHWRGPELRPLASNMLVHLATHTTILSNPASVEEYVKDQLKNSV